MPGIGAEAVQPLNLNGGAFLAQAIQPAQQIVNPSAVAALSQAFREGQVSADDIISRYGDVAKAKDKAMIQGLDEFISPEAIQARKDLVSAQGGQARLAGAKAKAELPLIGLESDAKSAQLEALRTQAELSPNRYDLKRDFALQAGFDVPDVPKDGPNEDWQKQVNEVFKKATKYRVTQANALGMLQHIESKPAEIVKIVNGQKETRLDSKNVTHIDKRTGAIIDPKTYQRLVGLAYSLPGDHEDNPVTMIDAIMGTKPGTVVEPKTASSKTPVDDNFTYPAIGVTPAAPTPAASAPMLDTEGVLIKSEPATEKAPTEAQQRAELAIARFGTANEVFNYLSQKGYDPTSVTSWVNRYLPEIIKSGDRKTYDSAVDAWSQGLLRLESGAAISRQEKGWYEKAFFPQVNDPPVVVATKEQMRHDVEKMTAEIAQAGNVVSPQSAEQAKKIYDQAANFAGGVKAFSGANTSAPAGKSVIPVPGNASWVFNPTTGQYQLKPNSAP